ncbi:MAG TPA: hypothetical protein VGJ11_10545 [Gaiellales bacterium]|jgi:hypothetical protein
MPGWFALLATALVGAVGVGLVVRAALRSRSRAPVPAAVAAPARPRRLRPVGKAAAPAASPVDVDRSRLVGWRFGLLLGAGLEARLALRLAERTDVDIHEVMDLVGGGCPAALAARIAEPL